MDEAGTLQVISGPMFAGKSEELMRLVRRARIAGRDVVLVSHALDDRRGAAQVASHAGARLASHAVSDAAALASVLVGRRPDLLAIDEVQFFGEDVVGLVEAQLNAGVSVVVAGLSVTLDGRPFEPTPALMARAEVVRKLTAVCTVCGRDAAFHVRLTPSHGNTHDAQRSLIGGSESYQARCRTHASFS